MVSEADCDATHYKACTAPSKGHMSGCGRDIVYKCRAHVPTKDSYVHGMIIHLHCCFVMICT